MKKCLICESNNLKLFKKVDSVSILECTSCRLGITDYGRIKKVSTAQKVKLYDYSEYLKNEPFHKSKSTKILDILKSYIKTGKILDVGAGFGLFSKILIETKKYTLEVVEPDLPTNFLKEILVKKYIHKKTYEAFLNTYKKRFDGIVFLDVLEHFKDPQDILIKTLKILKKKSYIIIQLPNYKSIMRILSKNWSWWMIEDHSFHFSPTSIKKLLIKNGYTPIHITTYENFIDFKKNLDGNFTYIKYSVAKRTIKGLFFSFFIPLYFLFRKVAWSQNLGGLLLIVAKKK